MIALVTDAVSRNALAAVRTLARRGIEVWTAGTSSLDQSFYSRYSSRRILYPSPVEDYESFTSFMLGFVSENKCDVLLPISDYETLFCCRHQDELNQHTHLAVPSFCSASKALDKPSMLKLAEEIGIQIPATFYPRTADDLEPLSKKISYPCVVKPKRSAGAVSVQYPRSAEELLSHYPLISDRNDPIFEYSFPMVQEYVDGEVHDVCLLFDRGEPVAALTQRRIVTYPPSGGKGTLNETTDEPELKESAIELLKLLDWHGPAQVEFRMDRATGTPKLMEVNGRFWGTLDLAIKAGIDFPSLACDLAIGKTVPPHFRYAIGIRYRWVVPYLFAQALHTEHRFRFLRDLFISRYKTRCEFRLADPIPFPVHIASCLLRWLSRRATQ